MLLLQRCNVSRRKKRRRNASLIFGDSGFSRSGALKIALSTSRNLAIREGLHMYSKGFIGIYRYLDVFIAIYFLFTFI